MVLHKYDFLCILSHAPDWTGRSNHQNTFAAEAMHPLSGLHSNEDVVQFTWKFTHFNWN